MVKDEVFVGTLGDGDSIVHLNERDINKHILITGTTGSGKTNLCKTIAIQLRVPAFVFDVKGSWRNFHRYGFEVYTFGVNACVNPLIPPSGMSKEIWLLMLRPILCKVLSLTEGARTSETIMRHLRKSSNLPSILNKFETDKGGSWEALAKVKLESLCAPGLLHAWKTDRSWDYYIHKNVVWDVSVASGIVKDFLMASFLLFHFLSLKHLQFNRLIKCSLPQRARLNHVTILEEFHRLLGVKEFGEYFAEIREFGEGIIAVEQSPSLIKKLTPQALTNFNTVFAFASPYGEDKNVLSSLMGLDEDHKEVLTNIPVGFCLIKLPSFPPKILETYMFEELVGQPPVSVVPQKETVHEEPTISSPMETREKPLPYLSTETLSDKESILLEDVYSFPPSLTVERIKRLGFGKSSFYKARSGLIERGLIKQVKVVTPDMKSNVVLLELTGKGGESLGKTWNPKEGGVVHKFYVEKIAECLRAQGFEVCFEKEFGELAFDLYCVKGEVMLGVEVETQRSVAIKEKVVRCLRYCRYLVVACLNQEVLSYVRSVVSESDRVRMVLVFDIFRL